MLKNRGEKGITLIALIITIIVLLILAGVSIATLTGENGILETSKKAKEQQEIATAQELLSIELSNILTDDLGNKDLNKLNGLSINGYATQVGDIGRIVTMTKNNVAYNFLVDSEYNIHDLNDASGIVNENNSNKTESSLIKKVSLQHTIYSNKIVIDIVTEKESSAEIKGYLIYCDNKLYCTSDNPNVEIQNLTKNTSYKIYCEALDQYGNAKSSEQLNLTTKNAEYVQNNTYAIITENGIMNKRFVNVEDESDFYYELDLDSDESFLASDSFTKIVYDSDETTNVTLTNQTRKFEVSEATWNKIIKINATGYMEISYYNESGTRIGWTKYYSAPSESTIPENATMLYIYFNGTIYDISI